MLFASGGVLVIVAYVAASYLVGRVATASVAENSGLAAALAAPAGASILGLELWALGAVGAPWNPLTLLLPPAILVIAARSRLRQALAADLESARAWWRAGRADPFGHAFVVAVLVVLLSLYLWALAVQPLEGNDAIALWMFKAKVFFVQHRVDLAAVIGEPKRNLDYPPLYPLLADSVYAVIGGVSDNLGKAVAFPFVLAAPLTLLVATAGARNRRVSGLFVVLVTSVPLFLTQVYFSGSMGYADYALAVMILVVVACVARAEATRDPADYHLALVAAAIAAMLKNEGQVVLLTTALITFFRLARPAVGKLQARSLLVAGIALAPVVIWKVVAVAAGYRGQTDSMPAIAVSDLPTRAIYILNFAVHTTSFTNDFGWIFVALVLVLEFTILNRSSFLRRAAVLVVAVQIAAYFVTYLFTRFDLNWHLTTTFDRLALQVTPALVLLLALGLAVGPAEELT